MHSDNRWDEATAGRVYPKAEPVVNENVVRARLELRAAFERNRVARAALFAEPLVKPASYKARNESSGSGTSGARSF